MTEDSRISLINFSNSIFRLKEVAIRQLLAIVSACSQLKMKPENRPLYQLNLLDMVPTEEPHTSKILAAAFNYTERDEYVIWESFVDSFLSRIGLDKSRIVRPVITAEVSHVDVRILDRDYAVIIENKLMNAPFQRNQLGRYIEHTHGLGYRYEDIFVVIIPQYFNPKLVDSLRASLWKCPSDGLWTSNSTRHCSHFDLYHCWCDDKNRELNPDEITHCARCRDFHQMFRNRTTVIHERLSDWLYGVEHVIEPRQTILKSALHQFADYTKGLFDIRINDSILMDIQKLIKETMLPAGTAAIEQWDILNEKSKELGEIQSAMSAMKIQLSKDLIDEWYRELKPEFECLNREVQKSFGININGVWVGCWCGSDNGGAPYWGFYCENKGSVDQQQMVRQILEECDIRSAKTSANFINYFNTRNGAERCRQFYNAAKRLGYL